MKNGKTTILIADDHAVVRMGLRTLIDLESDLAVVGEAGDGEEAVAQARRLAPDIAVIDLMMPKMNGADASAVIARECPGTKILILTTFSDSGDVARAIASGAVGAIVKDSSHAELIAAIRTVAAGGKAISRDISQAIAATTHYQTLSPRHREVLAYASKGLTNNEIAKLLGVGVDCVKAHLKTAFARLGVANRSEAVATAMRLHLIES